MASSNHGDKQVTVLLISYLLFPELIIHFCNSNLIYIVVIKGVGQSQIIHLGNCLCVNRALLFSVLNSNR